MLFVTGALLGICAGLLRSAFSIALVAALIVFAFLLAGALSTGGWPLGKLAYALFGYNLGLLHLLGVLLLARRRYT